MNASWIYCAIISPYINETIMLYALNLHRNVWQLFFNKTGESTKGYVSIISHKAGNKLLIKAKGQKQRK